MTHFKADVKEGAGFVKEEIGEKMEKSSNPKTAVKGEEWAHEGRDLRNEGRVEKGKAPKLTEPGTTKKDEE